MAGTRPYIRRCPRSALLFGASIALLSWTSCMGDVEPASQGRAGGSERSSLPKADDRPASAPPSPLDPESGPPQPVPASCRGAGPLEARAVASAPALRRLAMDQYTNSLRDLLGDEGFTLAVHADPAPDGNALAPAALRVTQRMVTDLEDNAWRIARPLAERLRAQLRCAPESDGDCLTRALDTLALWFHRRPPDAATRARYGALFDKLRANELDPKDALEPLVAAFAQAPEFVYQWDAARGPQVAPGVRRLDDWQLAEHLALFVWRSGPDARLRELTGLGRLSDETVFAEELQRIVDDPRSRRTTGHFVTQWLMLGGLADKNKEESAWSPALAQAFQEDTERVFAGLMTGSTARFADLFSHRTAWVTRDNASLLGQSTSDIGDGRLAELEGQRRIGLLTHNAFSAAHSKVRGSSPILRGVVVTKQVLCQEIASPPDDLEIPPEPEHEPGKTARDLLSEHRKNPACASCHRLLDPPGLALELWDGLGRYRETEDGETIDPSGELLLDEGAPVQFKTPEELFTRIGASRSAHRCFVTRWFEQGMGKPAALASERCALENVDAAVAAAGGGLRATLEQIARHPSFSLRSEGVSR